MSGASKKTSMVLLSVGLGITWAVKREMRNHDAAFNQMMWEIWENPERDPSSPVKLDPRVKELQAYLAKGFWHTVFREPPFDAVEHFDGVSVAEYDKKCLAIAKNKFNELWKQIEIEDRD